VVGIYVSPAGPADFLIYLEFFEWERVMGMKKPLAVANTVSQGLNGDDHFLNHQKRSIKPTAIMK
jgi:hypothetical protein